MNPSEIATTETLVRSLVGQQFPEFSHLPVERFASAGTDNAMYRLGNDLAVRLPRVGWAVDMVTKEQRWVPVLASQLSLRVPLPIAHGSPCREFPHPWSIVEWLPGEIATLDRLADPVHAAETLGRFVNRLQQIEATAGPTHVRGGPVRNDDEAVRRAIAGLNGELDSTALERAWERVLEVPDYSGLPRWSHGDLGPLNLLAHEGCLTSVIDWGTCGVGDTSVDARVAWNLFDQNGREAYRTVAGFDDESWERGKGWILTGVTGVVHYRDSNPALVQTLINGIQAVLDDKTG